MVFQDPMSSLDPVYRIGDQIVEQIRVHDREISKAQALDRAVELMERVGIPRARERLRSYPHEFSGGMRQRVMIAMALSCSPKPADRRRADDRARRHDPGADPRRAAHSCATRRDAGIILVTHDLGVVADIADRVVVMYAGRVVEQGTLDEIFYDPQHPYTWGLLGSITRVDRDRSRAAAGDPRAAAVAADAARGLPLPPALPARVRALHRGARAESRACPRRPSTRPLLARGRARSASCAEVGDQIGLATGRR